MWTGPDPANLLRELFEVLGQEDLALRDVLQLLLGLVHCAGQQSQIKYSCNQCDHQASTQGNLKIHIQSLHEKIQYSCNQCDYQATPNGDLKAHIQSVHEKINYSCNQCDHQATGKGNLKKHINILIWGSEDSYS